MCMCVVVEGLSLVRRLEAGTMGGQLGVWVCVVFVVLCGKWRAEKRGKPLNMISSGH